MDFIGVIDSGVGGLTILQQLQQSRQYNYRYVADHAFCPYGNKPNSVIYSRASKLVHYLKSQGAKAVVLACNTMSCFDDKLQQEHNLPMYDVIAPTCKRIASSNARKVALLATKSTIANGYYQKLLSQYGIQVVAFDCSAFVPYVEQGAATSLACQRAVDNALRNLPKTNADAVILGCTHFPLLRSLIAYYCDDAAIVQCSCDLPTDIAAAFDAKQSVAYLTTGDADFAITAAQCFKDKRVVFQHISII